MSKVKAKKTKTIEPMPIVNLHAAGIDVGSRSHYVAVGQAKSDVKEFGVYTSDLHQLCQHLLDAGITTAALESTGSYWQPLFAMLQEYQLNPILVNGKFTKNVKGRKTDVQDCQWIQKLHSMGMLEGSYLPDFFTEKVRHYYRLRQDLIEKCASCTNVMQKTLRLSNIRLDAVLRDIMGRSGKDIIEAITAGERNPEKLASLAQKTVKAPYAEIVSALTGDWREENIYELRTYYKLYRIYQEEIVACDVEIKKLLDAEIQRKRKEDEAQKKEEQNKTEPMKVVEKYKKAQKNDPHINIQQLAVDLTGGVDISEIAGVGPGTLLCLTAEIGLDMSAFPTAKHFCSWLRLSPNLKKTGGKVQSDRTGKRKNRVAKALMQAANAIGNKKKGSYLVPFFKRTERKGRMVAVVATARKLAVIIWNMLSKKEAYNPMPLEQNEAKIREKQIKNIQKRIKMLGVNIEELVCVKY